MDNAEPDILPALLRTTPAAVRHAESAFGVPASADKTRPPHVP